ITLYEAAVVPTALPINAVEGQAFSGPVTTFVDPAGPEVVGNYAAMIDWGDGTASTAGTISLSGNTFTVFGTHTYAEEGQYVVSMMIDHEAASCACIFETLATVADAPLLASANPVSAT